MWRFVFPLLLSACSPADQESVQTVAAVEVLFDGNDDRLDLLAMLRRHADASGLHVDDGSADWRKFEQQANHLAPEDRLTFNVGVWRGVNDDENEALADDRFHPGKVWVTFPRGSEPERSKRFREPLVAEIRQHWPTARAIPILPGGGIPHARDLVRVKDEYRIKRSEAAKYELPASSPIISPE